MSNDFIEELRRESILSAEQAVIKRMEHLFPSLWKQSQAESEQAAETPLIKTNYVTLLNRIVELQEVIYYHTIRGELIQVEQAIVSLEKKLNEALAENVRLTDAISNVTKLQRD